MLGEFFPEKPFDDWRNYSKTRCPISDKCSGLLLERRGERFTYIQPSDELNTSPKPHFRYIGEMYRRYYY